MSAKLFAPVCQLQLPSHCGPCSLSACLFILGISVTQRQLARAAGRPESAFVDGVDEEGLRRAARTFGAKSEFVLVSRQSGGRAFVRRLRKHLRAGNPAVLLCRDLQHWVAVIGYLWRQRRFIVVDPKAKNAVFFRWSEATLLRHAWNRSPEDAVEEPDQYFAILLSLLRNRPPRWSITESWLRLCERGSADTAESMARDLSEIAALASPNEKDVEEGPTLADVLTDMEESILDSITHWASGHETITRSDLRTFYRDYTTIATSTGIRVSADTDRAKLSAQLTAVMCSYWWGARF
jgi:hypothetical protein